MVVVLLCFWVSFSPVIATSGNDSGNSGGNSNVDDDDEDDDDDDDDDGDDDDDDDEEEEKPQFNHKIISIKPDTMLQTNLASGQSVKTTFTVTIGLDDKTLDFATSPDNSIVQVVPYYISAGDGSAVEYQKVATAINGGIVEKYSDICEFFTTSLTGLILSCDLISGQPKMLDNYPKAAKHENVTENFTFTETYTLSPTTIPNLKIGDKYCLAIAVSNYSTSSEGYFISKSTCTNITDYPSFQVWGGSTATNGGIKTSYKNTGGRIYGSWSELSVVANGLNNNFASGSATASGLWNMTNYYCTISPLSIENINCRNSEVGKSNIVVGSKLIDHIISTFSADSKKPEDVERGTIYNPYRAEGFNCSNIGGSDLSGSNPVIVYCPGNARITHSFTPRATYYQSANTPQIIVIAEGNIIIDEDVTSINAWLLSRGTINTCGGYAVNDVLKHECNKQLVINGLVVANKIQFNRTTYGSRSLDVANTYTELITFNPPIYYFSFIEARNNSYPRVTYIKKKAPRY